MFVINPEGSILSIVLTVIMYSVTVHVINKQGISLFFTLRSHLWNFGAYDLCLRFMTWGLQGGEVLHSESPIPLFT